MKIKNNYFDVPNRQNCLPETTFKHEVMIRVRFILEKYFRDRKKKAYIIKLIIQSSLRSQSNNKEIHKSYLFIENNF